MLMYIIVCLLNLNRNNTHYKDIIGQTPIKFLSLNIKVQKYSVIMGIVNLS